GGGSQDVFFRPAPINYQSFPHDALVALKVTVNVTGNNSTKLTDPPIVFYVYRYLDAEDDNTNDGILKFNDTYNDGPSGVIRNRDVSRFGSPDAPTTIGVETGTGFSVTVVGSVAQLTFDPSVIQNDLQAKVYIVPPGGPSRTLGPGKLTTLGNGVGA